MKTVPSVLVVLAADSEPARLCTAPDADAELFFPIGTSGPALLQIAEAKSICRRCPAEQECRTEALARPDHFQHGVVGGLSEDERHAIVRRRNRGATS